MSTTATNVKLTSSLIHKRSYAPVPLNELYNRFCGTYYESSMEPEEITKLRDLEVTEYQLKNTENILLKTLFSFKFEGYVNYLHFEEVENSNVIVFYTRREFQTLVKQVDNVSTTQRKLAHLPTILKSVIFKLMFPDLTDAEKILLNLKNRHHHDYCWSSSDFIEDIKEIIQLKKLELELAFPSFCKDYPEVKSSDDIFTEKNIISRIIKIDVSVDDDGKTFFVVVYDDFTTKVIKLH